MIQLDYRDPRPIYEQVADGIEQLVLRGALAANSQLPSVRQLAMELSINPNTIQRSYGELERRGVIYSAKGKGNFVSDNADALRRRSLDELGMEIGRLGEQARALGATDEQLCGWVLMKGEDNA